MKHCFIIPRIPTALIFTALLILFLSFWTYVVNFWHSSISLFVIFFILSRVFSASTWFLNSLLATVSQGPVHQILLFHLGPGSLGLSVTKKALSQTVRNFWTRPECFRKHTFGVWIWTQTFYCFHWNRDFYRPLNMSHRGTRNTGSTYVRMEVRKNLRLKICPRIWQGNIFPISWDQ